ncbi:MAG: hypothetical protein NT178_17380 [Proteobacteria bacterium]|nr:hypothetical protein [Pseudomonadota bacterium]
MSDETREALVAEGFNLRSKEKSFTVHGKDEGGRGQRLEGGQEQGDKKYEFFFGKSGFFKYAQESTLF